LIDFHKCKLILPAELRSAAQIIVQPQVNWEVGENPTLPPQRCSNALLVRQQS